jgi:hypothetical protein
MTHIRSVDDILRLDWVSTDELDLLPQKPGVYFVVVWGVVIYVGKSQNIMRRWMSHHRFDQIIEMGGADIHYIVTDARDAGALELEMIRLLSPELNNTKAPSKFDDVSYIPAPPVAPQQVSSTESLMLHLSRLRGHLISQPTFYRWLSICGVVANGRSHKGYAKKDIKLLEQLANHLRGGYSYESFIEFYVTNPPES